MYFNRKAKKLGISIAYKEQKYYSYCEESELYIPFFLPNFLALLVSLSSNYRIIVIYN